ncbi:MAG: hypothetical protein AAB772_00140, partial [Patescibacteria group bacterium]
MENSNKKLLIIGSAAGVILALIIAYGFYSRKEKLGGGSGGIGEPDRRLDAAGETILSEAEKARQGPFPTVTKEEIKPQE